MDLPVVNGKAGDATVRLASGLCALFIAGITGITIAGREVPTEFWVMTSSLITFLVGTRVVTTDTADKVKKNGIPSPPE